MKCANCGLVASPGVRFCSSCGTSLAAANHCGDCGAELKPSTAFCTSCGRPVGPAVSAPDSLRSAPLPEPASVERWRQDPVAVPQPAIAENQRGVQPKAESRKGAPGLVFWLPFLFLLLMGVLGYWGGGVSAIGWLVLTASLATLFLLRRNLLARGAGVSLMAFAGTLVLLFIALAITAQPSETPRTASGGSLPVQTPASPTVASGGAAAGGPAVSNPSPTPTLASKPSATTQPTAKPTPTRLKGAPPDALKPLLAGLGKQPDSATYEVTQDGDNSYAWLSLQVRGPVQQLSNWMGDSAWTATVSFHASEARAKSDFESLLKSTRESTGFSDAANVFLPREEKPIGRGDDGYSFTRAWKDQPQASMRDFVARQGASTFYVYSTGDSNGPAVPGDGIDILLAELKKLDNRALMAMAPGESSAPPAAAAPTAKAPAAAAQPTPAPVPAAGPRVSSMTFGLDLTPDQVITKPSSAFVANTAEIFLSLTTDGVTSDTPVDVTWTYLPTGDSIKGPTQRIIADARVGFSLTRPTDGWPPGEYKVVVLLNGRETASAGFSVRG